MPADELGGGMGHDVRAEVHRSAQVRRGEGVVYDQGNAGVPGDGRHRLQIQDVVQGVAYDLGVNGFGLSGQGLAKIVRGVGIDEDRMNAELSEGDIELRISAAVQGGG